MKKLIAAISILASTGCASIVSNSTYPVSVQGTEGQKFQVKTETGIPLSTGTVPSMISLKASDGYFSGADYTIYYKSECNTQAVPLTSELDPWYIGNILFGGLIGLLIVDPATGAMWKLPATIHGMAEECDA